MKISSAYPSSYIRASDLNTKPWSLTIRNCVFKELSQGNDKEQKPILDFEETEKRLVLIKTNANVIADAYGDETADWVGKPIGLYRARVEFKGNLVDGIRVRIPEEPSQAQPSTAPMADNELTGDVPF